jgi:hypothetical protein
MSTKMNDGLPSYAELLERDGAPPGSTWRLFGDGDELGAVNLLTAERLRDAAACVRRGVAFSLDYPINTFPTPSRPLARHTVIEMAADWRDDSLDCFFLQQTTQVDGLRHVRHTVHGFYGGADAERLVAGDPTNGINRWAERGIAGRGVLVDVARYRESAGRPLDHEGGDPITPELLDDTLAAQATRLSPADMILLRTDYPRHLREHGDDAVDVHRHAGLVQSHEMLGWLWDHRVPLVAADNFAVECIPVSTKSPLGDGDALGGGLMHPHLIALLGMVVGELWKLDDLAADCAADGVYEFLLVVKPLNLIGGVGSPANATAIK